MTTQPEPQIDAAGDLSAPEGESAWIADHDAELACERYTDAAWRGELGLEPVPFTLTYQAEAALDATEPEPEAEP